MSSLAWVSLDIFLFIVSPFPGERLLQQLFEDIWISEYISSHSLGAGFRADGKGRVLGIHFSIEIGRGAEMKVKERTEHWIGFPFLLPCGFLGDRPVQFTTSSTFYPSSFWPTSIPLSRFFLPNDSPFVFLFQFILSTENCAFCWFDSLHGGLHAVATPVSPSLICVFLPSRTLGKIRSFETLRWPTKHPHPTVLWAVMPFCLKRAAGTEQ